MKKKKILVIATIFMSFILALFVIEGLQKRDLQAGVDSEIVQSLNEGSDTSGESDSSNLIAGNTSEAAVDSSGISFSEPSTPESTTPAEIVQDSDKKKQVSDIRKVITENLFKRVELYSVSEQETYTQDNLTGAIQNGSAIKLDLYFEGGETTYEMGETFTTSFPSELGLTQDIEGTFSDGSAKYTVSATTKSVTIEFLRNTTNFKATLNITMNIPMYSETEDSIKKIRFDSAEPVEFIVSIYQDVSSRVSFTYYDANDVVLSQRPYMPISRTMTSVANQKGNDLSNGKMVLNLGPTSGGKPSSWTDGYVGLNRDSMNFTFKEFTRNIKGEKMGTGTLLELNKDYTITTSLDGYNLEISFIGSEPTMGLIEYSYGLETFDYSTFNPAYASASSASANSISTWTNYYIRKKTDMNNYVEGMNMNSTIEVSPFVFLSYKTTAQHAYISNSNALELAGNTLYVNLSGEKLKKGKEIILSITDKDGNANYGAATLYRKDLVKESELTIKGTEITEKSSTSLKNWEIKDDPETGTIILTYIGEDTTEAFGIEYFLRASEATSGSYLNAVDKDKQHSATRVYSQITLPTLSYPEISKSGQFSYNNKMVDWKLRINRAYVTMENAQLIDTPGSGNGENITNLTLKTIPFVPTDAVKTLVEGVDYAFVKNENGSFKLNFLKNFDEQLAMTYTQDLEYSELDEKVSSVSNQLVISYITDDKPREATVIGIAVIPDYVRTNAPLVKESSSGPNTMINPIAIIINPAGQTGISNSEFTLDMDSKGLEKSAGSYRIYEMTGYTGTYSSITYNYNTPLTEGDADFPTITEQDGILTIKNANLNRPIVIFMSVRMSNYYTGGTINSFSVPYSSSDYTGPVVVPMLSFGVWYDMTGSFNRNPTYDNVLDINLTVPKKQGKLLKTQTRFTIQVNGTQDHQLYDALIGATDDSGNLIPPSAYEVTSVLSGTATKYYYITLKEDLANGLNMSLPLAYDTPGQKSLSIRADFSHNGGFSYSQTKDAVISASPLLDFVLSGGEGILQMTNLTIKKIDNLSKAPLADAEFKLIDWSGVEVASGKTDDTGVLAISDIPTNNYHLVEVNAPEGYLVSEEYTGEGKEIKVIKSEADNQFIVENQATSQLNVIFAYEDGTPIKDVSMIRLEGLAGDEVDLTSKSEIIAINKSLKAQESSYLFKGFDLGHEATGTEDKLIMPIGSGTVYYKYQGLVQFSVSPTLNFESGLILPFTQTLDYDNNEDFILSVKDNRQFTTIDTSSSKELRGDFKVYATLTDGFKTLTGDSLVGAELSYGGSSNKIINQNAQLLYSNQHDVSDAEKAEFLIKMDGTDTTDSGFKLLVPPGTAKKETYKAKIKWELVEAP